MQAIYYTRSAYPLIKKFLVTTVLQIKIIIRVTHTRGSHTWRCSTRIHHLQCVPVPCMRTRVRNKTPGCHMTVFQKILDDLTNQNSVHAFRFYYASRFWFARHCLL